ncbi:MAG: peptidase T [Lachnospiraceae bacterium]|nr:peptidase T [Lachnospiraceae bacterium]
MRAYERLLRYVKVWTTSDDDSDTVPTTARQFDLARILVDEMKELGIEDARVDDMCYVYGSIPAAPCCEEAPAMGFIAHMDTAPDFNGENVQPRLIENYDGGEVVLGTSGRVLSPEQFPYLPDLAGRTLIVTDGTTLLGSDDKSGIAEILTAVERIREEGIPHGKLCIAFTPDEEVGRGPHHFNVKEFGADFAYTLDGGIEGEIVYENFNAAGAEITVNGFNVHPGSAKDTMINAVLVALELNSMLPAGDVPAKTEGYEGFFHLMDIRGNVEKTEMAYIIRDHSMETFKARKEMLAHAVKVLNEKYGEGTVCLEMRDQYYNMSEKIMPHFHLIENAKAAAEEAGAAPVIMPERGGTDGAQLSFMGLPCPNIGTGGFAFHGPYEHATVEGLDLSVEIVLGIIKRYAAWKGRE